MKIIWYDLIDTTGIEEIKFKTKGLNCSEIAMAWTDVNTTYYDMVNGNPKLQGNYTRDGKLLLGWIC